VSTIPLEGGDGKPVGVAVSPDGRWLYAANGRTSTVSVVNLVTGSLAATIKVGRRPWGIALSRDGKRAYTANGLSNDVSVIDLASRRVIASIKVGDKPWGVAVGR
jgi:YVTN family beta-propeller protein